MKKPNFVEKYIIEDNICDGLLNYYEKNKDYRQTDKNASSVFIYPHNKNQWVRAHEAAVIQCMKEYCAKYVIKNSSFGLDRNSAITCFSASTGHPNYFYGRNALVHAGNVIASRVLAYVTYLNDIGEGGETAFLWQKLKIKPKKGLTLFWPTEFTHSYKHLAAPKEKKYLITGFINYI